MINGVSDHFVFRIRSLIPSFKTDREAMASCIWYISSHKLQGTGKINVINEYVAWKDIIMYNIQSYALTDDRH